VLKSHPIPIEAATIGSESLAPSYRDPLVDGHHAIVGFNDNAQRDPALLYESLH
jgi:hypothetical protein